MTKMISGRKNATFWNEWFSLTGIFMWFFCSMYNFEDTLVSGYWYVFSFLIALATALFLFGRLYGDKVLPLSKLSQLTVPIGAVCTSVMLFLPMPLFVIAYVLSAIFMAPMLLRRVYGVVTIATEGKRFRSYMSAVAVTILFFTVWQFLPIGFEIKFPVLAVLALLSLIGVTNVLPEILPPVSIKTRGYMRRGIVWVAAVAFLFISHILFGAIHSFFISFGLESDLLMFVLGSILPAIGFIIFAWFADKKREHIGFILGISFALLGLVLVFIPGNSLMLLPLIITDGIGGTFTEYFIISSSLYFMIGNRRPILIASFGLIINILIAAADWISDLWLPAFLTQGEISTPMVVLAAVFAILLLVTVLYLLDKQKEKNLVLTILGFVKKETDSSQIALVEKGVLSTDETLFSLIKLGFSDLEKNIAQLLCQGYTNAEIARRLSVTSNDVVNFHQYNHSNPFCHLLWHLKTS